MYFNSPFALVVCGLISVTAAITVWLRRPALPGTARTLGATGLICLTLAAGGAQWIARDRPIVAVMVDCSASTRTAGYRDLEGLKKRVTMLLPRDAQTRFVYFSEHGREDEPTSATLPDLAGERTTFAPPDDADAVLLFSDGRFEPQAGATPPTFVVIDAQLDATSDAAVVSLELRDDHETVAATVRNAGSASRRLTLAGVRDGPREPIGEGAIVITAPVDRSASRIVARLTGDSPDHWPENDEMTIVPPPRVQPQRWWVGALSPDGWRRFDGAPALPTDSADYLLPSVIALHNVPADDVTPKLAKRLRQYVRDLGGTLILIGGDRAFAAGGYTGSALDALSPLSSAPPTPTTHWILLADASGSMAAATGSPPQTRWQIAAEALQAVVPTLPPDDLVSAATFARELRWWTVARPVRDVAAQLNTKALVGDAQPSGPTNLQTALQQIAAGLPAPSAAGLRTELLILSDADASIDDPVQLARQLSTSGVRVHLLATAGAPRDENPVRQLAAATGGTVLVEADAANWAQRLKHLVRAASDSRIGREPLTVHFDPSFALPDRVVTHWNRTWPKERARVLASAPDEKGQIPMAAMQRLGLGSTLAIALDPTPAELDALLTKFERLPLDPRFEVSWRLGSNVAVQIDARDPATGTYLNELRISVLLRDPDAPNDSGVEARAIPQVAPGRYALTFPSARSPRTATVTVGAPDEARVIARAALAGRYAPELDAVGNDRAALRELARRTAGRVIEPGDSNPIARRELAPPVPTPLSSVLAAMGAVAISAALVAWRRSA